MFKSGKDKYKQKVIASLKKLKFNYQVGSKMPVLDNDNIVAYLRPVSKEIALGNKYIRLLSKWRKDNLAAYPTVFKVTEKGTHKWMVDQLLKREDRILFLIETTRGRPVGHLGLSNFDFSRREAEIDNVVRGEAGILLGIITLSLNSLVRWAFDDLVLRRLFLRVFLDNEKAIRLYERCGFKGIRKIPLHKSIDGETVRYEEIQKGKNLSVDRIFYLMELNNK